MSAINSAVIIGGGIAGPVAATALRRAGIKATVYEAYPGPAHNVGSALGFAPNGLAALDVIGAGDAVRSVAVPLPRTVMSVGHKQIEMPTGTGPEPLQVVDRSDLHRALHEHARQSGVRVEYGREFVDIEERPDGVSVRFADGSTADGDIVIGADGIKSRVRTLIDPHAPAANYTGMLGFGAYTDCDFPVAPGTMVFAYGRSAYYLYWSRPNGRIGWGANLPWQQYLSLSQARAVPAEQWLHTLRAVYREDTPGGELAARTRPDDLEVVGGLHIMPPVPHWYRDRLVLVGDAVHAPSNSTGQGASLAIESAIQLARCLRDADDPATAFATYERLRRPRVEQIAARGAKINQTKTVGPVLRRLLPVMMPLATKLMRVEQTMRREQSYTIDWDDPVDARAELAAG
ncbi:MAG: FAD-dependent monooxygenase [Nocardia sp.]|nr:FAD-dependent monooxygenase [Nocardia sp.]